MHGKLRSWSIVTILFALLSISAASVFASVESQAASAQGLDPNTQFYVPKLNHGAVEQIAELTSQGRKTEAALIREMISTPTAVWITSSSTKDAMQQVRQVTHQAAGKGTIPVLVAYNIPFRDCAQYSAGGATSVAEYQAWIDAVAAGIGDREAIVILEPDGLGIIPWYNPLGDLDGSNALEWCQPAEANPATAAAERFVMLNYAVDALKANPNTRVYLDGTHSSWLNVGDVTDRLLKAGVDRADGFFLNVSNYRYTAHLEKYGTWISQCIYLEQNVPWWNPAWCASQYYPANPNDFSTWHLTDAEYASRFASLGLNPSADELKHFVIDTSRNGQGPWTPPAGVYPDPQDWCNPPDRGLGLRPTANTGNPLIDAFLWIKVPGESDGQCTRGLGPVGTVDPEWGVVDPAAGHWFPQQALELVRYANPPLQ